MIVTPFAEQRPHSFNSLWCDGVTLRGVSDFEALLAQHRMMSADVAPLRVLCSLDDLSQAEYTSGHTTVLHELYDWSDDEEPATPPLRNDMALQTCLLRIMALAGASDFSSLSNRLAWVGASEGESVTDANGAPDTVLRLAQEREIRLQFVPVNSAADVIAAFPNGYFSCDLSPMDVWLLARHFEERHALELFGIGASWLAFRRCGPFDEARAVAAARDVVALYSDAPADAGPLMASLLMRQPWLLLRYTE
jgi:hypothetical protein